MILTKDVPPGTPPKDAATIRQNVDFPTYSKAVDDVLKAKNPKVTAIRVKRPPVAPEFAVDAKGNLVALLHDVELEVPAPDKSSQAGSVIGVPAKILRLKIPQLEIAFSQKTESTAPGSHTLRAKVEDFTPSPNSQVLAINDDESKPTALTRFSGALVCQRPGRPAPQPAHHGESGQRQRSRIRHPVDLAAGSLRVDAIEPGPDGGGRAGLVPPGARDPCRAPPRVFPPRPLRLRSPREL